MTTPQADLVAPPLDCATAGDFQCRKFTVGAVSAVNVLPVFLSQQFVSLYSPVECDFAFSYNSNATVDRTVAATDAGAGTLVGGKLLAGERRDMLLPTCTTAKPLYFVRQAASTSEILMERSSR